MKAVHYLRLLAAVILSLWSVSSYAQGILIRGTVVDADGLPAFGAGVTLKGTSNGVMVDMDGNFQITVPNEDAVIVVSSLGYVTEEIKVGKQRTLTVVLKDDAQTLEATVVVAYGTQKKATVTGALTAIDAKALVKAPVADVTNVLAGQMPGVTTVQESGQPGEDYAQIFIRGVSSLSDANSTPLILVDGVERPLNTIDPNEIESLSILKDASSTAVFGVRGANGVIIVTTKRGDAGKPKISASSITGVQVPLSFIHQAGSYDFARYYNVRHENASDPDSMNYFTREAIEAYRTGSDPYMYPNTNWTDLLFRKAFLQTKNNINISGGSDKVRYFVSMGYMFQNGLLKQMPGLSYDNNYAYNRYNYRANLDFKLTETTDMKFNISGVVGNTREPISTQSNIWMLSMLWAHPTSSPGIVNGNPLTFVHDSALPNSLTKWNPYEYYYGLGYTEKYKTTLDMDLTLTQRLDFITEGLSVGVKGSFDTAMQIKKKHEGSGAMHQTLYYTSWVDNSSASIADPDFDRTYQMIMSGSDYPLTYSESTDDDKAWYLEGRVDYSRKFAGKHAVSGLLLYNQSRNYYPSGYSTNYEWLPKGYVGFVARATYGYMDKYLVDFSAGYNGSENFAPGRTRYGFFPSMSLGWVMSEEPFMQQVGWIDHLKIRGSLGTVGNDQGKYRFMYMEGVWQEAGSYYFGVSDSGGVPRYEMGVPGNSAVTWETALKGNFGVDAELFNHRLSFTGDIFKEHRTGILLSPNTPPAIIATDLPNMNLGVVDNWGYEMDLRWNDHIGDFTYDLGANVTFSRNTIIYQDEIQTNEPYQMFTGGSTGRYLLYQYEGLYKESDFVIIDGKKVLNPDLPQPKTTVYPGDAKYADLNHDGKVNDDDKMVDGFPNRPEYLFGSNWKFGWKGFNLALNWVAATNVCRVYNADYRIPFTNSGHRGLLQMFADRCYIPEGSEWAPARTTGENLLPRMTDTLAELNWNAEDSTLWTVDSSYIRLKSLSFGYTFSRNKFFEKLGLSSLGIMFTGYNILTFSKMKLQDPEGKSSSSNGEYPLVKTYNIAINLNF